MRGSPLGTCGHVDDLVLTADGGVARGGSQPLQAVEQPGRADGGVSREVELVDRREDADLAAFGVVHEDDLAEAEVGGHGLAPLRRDLVPVEEHAERVPAAAVVGAEHTQEMESRHDPTLRSAASMRGLGPLTVAVLIPLAPTFQAAGEIAERVSERAAARPDAVFPVRARADFGEG